MLPALTLPESLLPAEVPPDVAPALEAWRATWRVLRQRVRTERPDADSEAETALLADFVRGLAATTAALAPAAGSLVRRGVERGLDDLLRQEFSASETERKLALRHLQQSLEVFGELSAFVSAHLRGVTDEQLATALARAAEEATGDPAGQLTPDARTLARWELNLFVALDVRSEPLEELTYWARRAVVSSREVRTLMARPSSLFLVEPRADEHFQIPAHVTLAPESARRVLDLLDASPGPNAALRELFDERRRPAP